MTFRGCGGCGGRKPFKNRWNSPKSIPDSGNPLQSPDIDFGRISNFDSVSECCNGVLLISNHKKYFLKQFSKRLRSIPQLFGRFSTKNRLWECSTKADPGTCSKLQTSSSREIYREILSPSFETFRNTLTVIPSIERWYMNYIGML